MNRCLPHARFVLPTLAPLAVAAAAFAQTTAAPAEPTAADRIETPVSGTSPTGATSTEGQDGAFSFKLDLRGIAELQSDFKGTGGAGSVEIYRASLALGTTYKFNSTISAGLAISSQTSWFNFNDAQALTPGSPRPYGTFTQVTVAPSVRCTPDEHWSYTVGGLVDLAGETDADVGDSITGGGFVVVGYKCSDTLTLSLGVIGESRLEDSFILWPLVGVDWKITSEIMFRVFANQNGPEARISAKLAEEWSIFLYGSYQARSYRLSDTSPVPDGVFRERSVPVVLGASYQCAENVEINVGVGVVAWRRFRQDNSSGVRIGQVETDPGALLFLGGRFTF